MEKLQNNRLLALGKEKLVECLHWGTTPSLEAKENDETNFSDDKCWAKLGAVQYPFWEYCFVHVFVVIGHVR